jgi:hypothetical protein
MAPLLGAFLCQREKKIGTNKMLGASPWSYIKFHF